MLESAWPSEAQSQIYQQQFGRELSSARDSLLSKVQNRFGPLYFIVLDFNNYWYQVRQTLLDSGAVETAFTKQPTGRISLTLNTDSLTITRVFMQADEIAEDSFEVTPESFSRTAFQNKEGRPPLHISRVLRAAVAPEEHVGFLTRLVSGEYDLRTGVSTLRSEQPTYRELDVAAAARHTV